jgi:hypothetical protein
MREVIALQLGSRLQKNKLWVLSKPELWRKRTSIKIESITVPKI